MSYAKIRSRESFPGSPTRTASRPSRSLSPLRKPADRSPRLVAQRRQLERLFRAGSDRQHAPTAADLLMLQRLIGNRAARRLLPAKDSTLSFPATNDGVQPAISRRARNEDNRLPFSNRGTAGFRLIQREWVPHPTTYKGPLLEHRAAVDRTRDELNERVQNAYQQALHWRTLGRNDDPLVRLWVEAAEEYARNPDVEPSLIHARFGYAIESLACQGLNNTELHGLAIATQVGHGHTRPDVVLSAGHDEVAWLDITSQGSVGHVKGKEGAGWASRPLVYEIVYPQLQLRALLEATNDPYYHERGLLLAGERQIEMEVKERGRTALRNRFIQLRDREGWQTGTGNAAEKRRATRDFFMDEAAQEGIEEDTASMINTRGALEDLGINPGPYGFNRGDVGSSNRRLNELVHAQSREEMVETQGQLSAQTTRRILAELEESHQLRPDLIHQLDADFWADPSARNTALAAMALKGALPDLRRLEAVHDHIRAMMPGSNTRVAQLQRDVRQHLEGPQAATHDAVMAWRDQAHELDRRADALRQVLQASDALHQFEQQQGIGFFGRLPQITDWFQQLAQDRPDARIAQEVMRWLAQQPQRQPQQQHMQQQQNPQQESEPMDI